MNSRAKQNVIGILLSILLACITLASCGTSNALQLTTLPTNIPADALKSPVIGALSPSQVLHVRITFKVDSNLLRQEGQQKIRSQQQSSPLKSVAAKLGISNSTYQKIKTFFSPAGIVLKLSKLRTHLAIDAKAGTLAKLLQTKFVVHRYQGRTFYAPSTSMPPKVPKFLADSIDAVTGLNNYAIPPQHDFTLSFAGKHAVTQPAQPCYALNQTLVPHDIAQAYGYDKLWNQGWTGQNMTVNLVEVDSFEQSDIQYYLNCINFQGRVSVETVDNAPTHDLGEATLDTEMVAGLARSANIVVYQTDGESSDDVWVNVNDELQQILNDNANNRDSGQVVSLSLGLAERDMTTDDRRAIDSSLQQLVQIEHMTVFVASGDCGAFADGQYKSLSVSFPASNPWVTSVGGTILTVNSNSNRAHEVAWSDNAHPSQCKNQWGSGGGNSGLYKQPNWQQASGVKNHYSRGDRQLPDLSAVAYALAVYFGGQWDAVGGTSAAAPIWATGMALVNEGLIKQYGKFVYGPQLFYVVDNQSNGLHPFYDVTQGNNLYYPATPGWDFATGLGTPNLNEFYQVLSHIVQSS